MKRRKRTDRPAVRLFWKRIIELPGTEAGLDVGHRDLPVESRERTNERRGRVSLNHDDAGLVIFQRLIDQRERVTGELGERRNATVPTLHEPKVLIRNQVKDVEDLIEH